MILQISADHKASRLSAMPFERVEDLEIDRIGMHFSECFGRWKFIERDRYRFGRFDRIRILRRRSDRQADTG
jgi:hypothetical protein